MIKIILPILVVAGSNCIYNICTKSTPSGINAFGSLAVTYLTATVVATVMFLITARPNNIIPELTKVNWSTVVLGFTIVGVEFGYIYMFRSGWKVSTCSLVSNITLACMLIFVGILLYKETISLRQIVGIAVCLAGLVMVTK